MLGGFAQMWCNFGHTSWGVGGVASGPVSAQMVTGPDGPPWRLPSGLPHFAGFAHCHETIQHRTPRAWAAVFPSAVSESESCKKVGEARSILRWQYFAA